MNIWNQILQILADDSQLYLLTVIQSKGSAPGRRGFMMLVDDKNQLYGSIGGGIMEFNMVETAKKQLKLNQFKSFCIKQIHRGDSKSSSGMICSGEQTIAFTPLSVKDKDSISACNSAEMIQISEVGLEAVNHKKQELCQIQSETKWLYTQKLNKSVTLHIFGAGHVSVPTCELLTKLGYQVKLYDNRADINTFNDNKNVVSKQLIDYSQINQQVKYNPDDFMLLMTHKFTEDKLILSQLLGKQLAYLGVLGSKNKIKIMFNALLNEGFEQSELDKVYAPIGLEIHSKTTDEIAVSIVAEIIKIKNN